MSQHVWQILLYHHDIELPLTIIAIAAQDALNQLFEYRLTALVSLSGYENYRLFNYFNNQTARFTLIFLRDHYEVRRITGVCRAYHFVPQNDHASICTTGVLTLHLTASLQLLDYIFQNRAFYQKTLQTIIAKVLIDAGLPLPHWQLSGANSNMIASVIQSNQQSTLTFVQHLLSSQNIFSWFDTNKPNTPWQLSQLAYNASYEVEELPCHATLSMSQQWLAHQNNGPCSLVRQITSEHWPNVKAVGQRLIGDKTYVVVSRKEIWQLDSRDANKSVSPYHCRLTVMPENTLSAVTAHPQFVSKPITRQIGHQVAHLKAVVTDVPQVRAKAQPIWAMSQSTAIDGGLPWLAVAQDLAGSTAHWLLSPGINCEAVVSFSAGNLTKPLILGTVYGGQYPTPCSLPQDVTHSGFSSHSHQFIFEDGSHPTVRWFYEDDVVHHTKGSYQLTVGTNLQREWESRQEIIAAGDSRLTIQQGSGQLIAVNGSITIVAKTISLKTSQTALTLNAESIVLQGGGSDWQTSQLVRSP